MSEAKRHMGFMYIGTAPCGCVTAMAWDDPGYQKDTAAFVSRIVRRGDAISRVERFEGDEMPMQECETHAAERAARALAKAGSAA